MANYREILRLASLKHSQREIAASLKCSRNTIGEVLNTATQKGMDIQEYVTKSCEKYAVSTVKKDVHVLNLIFRMAVINNLCLKNPVVEIHYPRETNKKEKRAFTQEQYDAAYELAKKWKNGASIMLMLALGLSRSELLGLKWENLDGEHHYISIEQSLVTYKDVDLNRNVLAVDNLKNEYRRRELPIVDDDLRERLWSINRYETVNGEEVETEFVFHNSKGKPWNPATWASRVFRPFMQALCTIHPDFPQLSVHEIRHTRGTLWVDQGVEPYMTTKMLGHCDVRMLRQVYDHTGADTLKKALLNPTR